MSVSDLSAFHELVQREVAAAAEELRREWAGLLGELRDELYDNDRLINRRIDAVHSKALRELTRLQSKGQTR